MSVALLAMLFAPAVLPPLLLAIFVAATFLALLALAATGGSLGAFYRRASELLGLIRAYFGIRRRWIQFVPPLLLWPAIMFLLWLAAPTVHTERHLFLREYSDFLQTAAQVLAALLIALAVGARASLSIEDTIAVRPATTLTVLLLALAELASLAVLSSFLPASLDRCALYLVTASAVAAILALFLVSLRILGGEGDVD